MKPIPDHVREAFPCCGVAPCRDGWHQPDCPVKMIPEATDLALAVRAECVALLREAGEMLRKTEPVVCLDCGVARDSERYDGHAPSCEYGDLMADLAAAVDSTQ